MPDDLFQTKLLHKIEMLYGGHTGISIFIAFASATTYCILFPITYERSLMCMHEGLPKFSVLILKKNSQYDWYQQASVRTVRSKLLLLIIKKKRISFML